MTSTILCVFAHPDDEAFGPGGTIAKMAIDNDVYIICATRGDAGEGRKGEELAEIRSKEIIRSGKILGVKKVYFLNFYDGKLSNSEYHKLAHQIEKYVKKLKPDKLLTFSINGVTGHLDHIAVSLATTYVFVHQRIANELWYYCMSKNEKDYFKSIGFDYFVYVPPAIEDSEADEIIDVTDVWDTRISAMNVHVSQKKDIKFVSKMLSSIPKMEYFKVLRNENI